MKLRILLFSIPLLIFIVLGIFLWHGLNTDPRLLPSTLINKPAPKFSVSELKHPDKQLTDAIFKGHVSLLNVWATWCEACAEEHPVLVDIAQTGIVPIYGLDYKDKRAAALSRLDAYGDPYQRVGFDSTGHVAINYGVYGAPETFIIDQYGVIRYKQVGPITHKIWQQTLLPIIRELKKARRQQHS